MPAFIALVELVFYGDFGSGFVVFGFTAEPAVWSNVLEMTESFRGELSLFDIVYTLSAIGQDGGWEVLDVTRLGEG